MSSRQSRVHRDWVTFSERNVAQSRAEILYLILGVLDWKPLKFLKEGFDVFIPVTNVKLQNFGSFGVCQEDDTENLTVENYSSLVLTCQKYRGAFL